MKHTPGPWKYSKQHNGSVDLFGNDGWTTIAAGLRLINQPNNIELIAAAPQLLDLVQFFVDNFGQPRCLENIDKYQEAVRLLNELKGETK